jgi:ribosomal protein S18 acetylase RimI-like enzyme|tara:strand:+ start:44 stop:547 length:504 start_codon:yes stop_codon:yes gene_type:complete
LKKKTDLFDTKLYAGISIAKKSDFKQCSDLWGSPLNHCLGQGDKYSSTDINKSIVFVIKRQSFRDYFSSTKRGFLNNVFIEVDYIIGLVELMHVLDEVEIRALVVDKKYRQDGFGEALLIASIEQSLIWSTLTMSLEVRVSNDIAISSYRKYGFFIVENRKQYYEDT